MTITMTRHASNPTLAPKPVVLKLAPGNAPSSPRMHSLNVDPLNFFFRRFRLNHSGYQEVLLPVQGFDRCPLGQHQFFGVQTVHRFYSAESARAIMICRSSLSFKRCVGRRVTLGALINAVPRGSVQQTLVPGAGVEPARPIAGKRRILSPQCLPISPSGQAHHCGPKSAGFGVCSEGGWRRDPESNRANRICNPVHNRFAIAPCSMSTS